MLVTGVDFAQIHGMRLEWMRCRIAVGWGCALASATVPGACAIPPGEDPERAAQLEQVEQVVAAHCVSTEDCACSLTVAQAGCEATLTDVWRARIVAGEGRGLTYDGACFDAIAAGIEAARCAWPANGGDHPCRDFCQVFHGTRRLDQSCAGFDAFVSDCEQGLVCDRGRCALPCASLSGLAEGEICRDADTFTEVDRCAQGLSCLGSPGRCARAPTTGEICPDGACDPDSYCDYFGEQPRCRGRAGVGASCEQAQCQENLDCVYLEDRNGYLAECRAQAQTGESCNEVRCAEGLACAGGLCLAEAELGESCSNVGCRGGLLCDFDRLVCVEPPPAGQPCPSGECGSGGWCDFSVDVPTCIATLAEASPCTGHRQCDSGFCPAGFCADRPAIGASCAGSLVCEIGASCDGSVCRPSVTRGPAVCVYEGW